MTTLTMNNQILRILALVAALGGLSAIARAEPVELTYNQASELYIALSSLDAGLSPSSTIAASECLIALRPHVESFDKAKAAAQRKIQSLVSDPDRDAKIRVVLDDLDAAGQQTVKPDLRLFELTEDEIGAAKLRPAVLAVLRAWLRPKT